MGKDVVEDHRSPEAVASEYEPIVLGEDEEDEEEAFFDDGEAAGVAFG